MTPKYWPDLACVQEDELFDGAFPVDVLGVYDAYAGTLRRATQVPANGPLPVIPAMAVTEHLGFGVTVNLRSSTPPPASAASPCRGGMAAPTCRRRRLWR